MTSQTRIARPGLARAGLAAGLLLVGCNTNEAGLSGKRMRKNTLAAMATSTVTIAERVTYRVWLARTSDQQRLGLMNTPLDELPADHGMLFVFDHDRYQSFWMRDTIIPLDIAFIRSDGIIVRIHTMQPLDESSYPSLEPARFALEVRAGQFAEHGVREGDPVQIPADVLNPAAAAAE